MWIAGKLAACIPPEGSLPDPQKAAWVLEHGLGVGQIRHPCNVEWVMDHLHGYWIGRIEGLNATVEKPKSKGTSKHKGRSSRGKSRR